MIVQDFTIIVNYFGVADGDAVLAEPVAARGEAVAMAVAVALGLMAGLADSTGAVVETAS